MNEVSVALTQEQVALLSAIVEASKSKREEFYILRTLGGSWIQHPALPDSRLDVYGPDLQALENLEMLTVTHYDSRNGKSSSFDVSPQGLWAYNQLHTQAVAPQASVVEDLQRFVDSEMFAKTYPAALERWQAAAQILWSGDANGPLTEVGHFCREAMQEFAAALSSDLPVYAASSKPDTVRRIRAVLGTCESRLGGTAVKMLEALLDYWGTVSDLAQRQEHAGAREGEPLQWEDARRLVFQTLVVMYEVDRAVKWGVA